MEYGRFEVARIVGSRALQIKMGAPVLFKVVDDISALEIAKIEYARGIIPITVKIK